MCLLMAFSFLIECHASKNNIFDHWEQQSIVLSWHRQGQICDHFDHYYGLMNMIIAFFIQEAHKKFLVNVNKNGHFVHNLKL